MLKGCFFFKLKSQSLLSSIQFSSVARSCLTLCDPMDCSTPGFPVHHQLQGPAQTHVHRVGDTIQPSYSLSSPSPAFSLSQRQGLFQWLISSHQVAKVLDSAFLKSFVVLTWLCFSIFRYNSPALQFTHLKCTILLVLSMSTGLCNHHHHQF